MYIIACHVHAGKAKRKRIRRDVPQKCDECSKTLSSKRALKVHMLGIHRKVRDLRCGFCPKTFALKYNVRVHEQKFHSHPHPKPLPPPPRKSFLCNVCGKKFTTNGKDVLKFC